MKSSALNIASSFAPRRAASSQPQQRNKFSASSRKPLAFSISQGELTMRCQRVMREHVGSGPDAVKRLASDLECSPGTAKNYLEGRTTPQGIHDARAMAVIPGYLALKAELADLEMNLDPRHQAKMAEFMRYCAAQADAIFGAKPDCSSDGANDARHGQLPDDCAGGDEAAGDFFGGER